MPDRRRHGAHEDRGAGGARREDGLSLHDRLVGYLPRYAPYAARCRGCSICATGCRARRSCRRRSPASARGAAAEMARPMCSDLIRHERLRGTGKAAERGRAVRRHLQPLFRAREPGRRARGAAEPAATACMSRRPRRRIVAAAVLRPHLPLHRRRSTRRGARRERMLAALEPFVVARRARWSGSSRAACSSFRDEIPAMVKGERRSGSPHMRSPSRNSWRAKPRRAGSSCR